MKMKKLLFLCSAFSILAIACSSSSGNVKPNNTLANLTLNEVVSQDSSGNVSFTAKADNAVTYDFDFGNGVIQTVATGIVTYKYPATGNYVVNVIAKNSSGQTLSTSASIAVSLKISLFWSDEFDTDGAPNGNKWGYDIGNGSGGWGNNELEYYTNRSQNVIVQGGILKITALKENYNGFSYTSARILTKAKFSFTYGRVEMKAMLPAGVGTWPALWLLGNNIDQIGWPACGEIDIMEQRGVELNKIYGTLHYPGHSGGNGNGSTINVANTTTQFHIYAMDWSPASIKLSVDGQVYQTVANTAQLPFNSDFFFIFNVAMGGNFAGSVDPSVTSATMQVDYVRVYK